MDARDVLDVLGALTDAGIERVWLDGGWGVDALLGEQHRDHADVDLVLTDVDVDAAIAALAERSFALTVDEWPTRLELRDEANHIVDIHPVRFDEAGTGWQVGALPDGGDAAYPGDGFTFGWVGGQRVECIGPEMQMDHHRGYEPTPTDREDVARLHERFHLPVPDHY